MKKLKNDKECGHRTCIFAKIQKNSENLDVNRSIEAQRKAKWRSRGNYRFKENQKRNALDRLKRKNETASERKKRCAIKRKKNKGKDLQNLPAINSVTPYFSEQECTSTYQVRKETETLQTNKSYRKTISNKQSCRTDIESGHEASTSYKQMVWCDTDGNERSARNKSKRKR